MRKFVIVMIALLVLFVFLMLNYLLWDKENLQNQSANDKFDLDQLRSNNRILQTTIDEQEQTINSLNKDVGDYEKNVAGLRQSVSQSAITQDNLRKQRDTKSLAIDNYKLLMTDSLKLVAQQWFDDITGQNYEDAFKMMDTNCTLFGTHYEQDGFNSNIAALASISYVQASGEVPADASGDTSKDTSADTSKDTSKDSTKDSTKDNSTDTSKDTSQDTSQGTSNETSVDAAAAGPPPEPVFKVLQGRGSEYEIIAVADVQVVITEEQKATYKDMVEGVNRLQISFRYNPDTKSWAIFSILESYE